MRHVDSFADKVEDITMPRTTNRQNDREVKPEQMLGPDSALTSTRPTPDYEEIAQRAYERFRMRGSAHGRDQEDWFEAERELRMTSDE